ncbi:M14 family zinc carboxypeptidase [Oceanisphaera avium]|uniref:M14 family zinc carboxypeptidase n=1 Tax=Oceanisphaera avium TaxID=1903694 RepID=UPI001E2DEA0D|nr:M14 family zinc carboxypeptidase [Oceanisphaera avium]
MSKNKPQLATSTTVSQGLHRLAEQSERLKVVKLGQSAGGRPIEAVLVSADPDFLNQSAPQANKVTVMLFGSQHGNEPAGSEALRRLVKEFSQNQHSELLTRLNLVLVVLANPDGRDLASRYNANKDNTNIDYVALAAGETQLLVDALHDFDPDVVYDAHESGIWKRVLTKQQGWLTDVEAQFDMGNNPNIDIRLHHYTEQKLLPMLIERVSEAGLPASRYRGEITQLEQSVARGGLGITNLRNYAALQGRVSILVENRLDNKQGHYDSPRNIDERIRKQHLSMLTMLQLVSEEAEPLLAVSRAARSHWQSGTHGEQELVMSVGFGVNESEPQVEIPLVRLSDGQSALHTFANHDAIIASQAVALPAAYAITREQARMATWLARHHIDFTTLTKAQSFAAQRLSITKLSPPLNVRSGVREKIQATVHSEPSQVTLSAGDLLVPMAQPLAPLAALMLDPRSANALYQEASWPWLALGEFPVFPILTPP